MATGMEALVQVPLRKRPRALLVDAADRIPNSVRWTAGVTLRPWGCGGFVPTDADYCDFEADELDDYFDVGEFATFEAFEVYNTESCSARVNDIIDLNSRLETKWSVMISEQVAARLNVEMAARATTVTTGAVNTQIALANAEEALALSLHGGQGYIHMSPAALTMFVDKLEYRDGNWETPSGHIVIADSGHVGVPPEGENAQSGTEWIYTSGAVLYGLSDTRLPTRAAEYLNRENNAITARIIGSSVVAFDPCAVSAIEYGYPDYEGSGS